MTKKKYRAAAAFMANLWVLAFAVIIALPGVSSFVSLSASELEEVAVAVDPFVEHPQDAPNNGMDLVLAASDSLTQPVPYASVLESSLASKGLFEAETVAADNALREYQDAVKREKRRYEFYKPYVERGITLEFDSFYSVQYRPEEEEYLMLCWVVEHEAGPASLQEEIMVCEAIFNRVSSSLFPNDLISVLTAHNQFNGLAGFYDAPDYEPASNVRSAVAYVLSGEAPDLVRGAVYFCNPDTAYHMNWFNTLEMTVEIPHYRFYK